MRDDAVVQRHAPVDHAGRRLAIGMSVSLLLHALILLLQYGVPALGLPGMAEPIRVRLAGLAAPSDPVVPAPVPEPTPPALAEPVPPAPEAAAPARAPTGMRLLDPVPQPVPVPVPVQAKPAVKKDKPRKARRVSTPLPAIQANEMDTRVIAQDATLNDFVVPLPNPEDAEKKTVDRMEAQYGSDDGTEATNAAAEAEAARAAQLAEQLRKEEETVRLAAQAKAAAEAQANKLAEEQLRREQEAVKAADALALSRQAEQEAKRVEDERQRQTALDTEARQVAALRQEQERQLARERELAAQQKAEQVAVQQRQEQQRVEQQKAEQLAAQQRADRERAEQQKAEQLAEQRKAEQQKAEQQRAELQKAEQFAAQQRAQQAAEQAARQAAQQAAEQAARQAAQQAAEQAARQAAQQAADQAARQAAQRQAALERDAAGAAGGGGPGGSPSGAGGTGGKATVPKDLLGSPLANRARDMVKGLDVLSGSPPPRQGDPRRVAVGKAERDLPLRMYVESFRQKVERNGAMNYPRSWADEVRIDPLVNVALRSDGTVEDVTILRSSGRSDMDEAVKRIVRVNARYSSFPPNVASRYDVIDIRRVWRFDEVLKLMEEVP